MEFDFVADVLAIRLSDGSERSVPLASRPVAEFYGETLSALDSLGIASQIVAHPNEVDPSIPFAEDFEHAEFDADAAHMFWQQLVQAHRVILDFRASFTGKVSPVHFFWGALDLACTRFSGRAAPPHAGGAPNCPDWVMVEGYSRELSSCGFWPGGGEEGAFYSYAYPEPQGFAEYRVEPDAAYYSDEYKQSCCPMRRYEPQATPIRRFRGFCTAPTRRRPNPAAGTERHSRLTRIACSARTIAATNDRATHSGTGRHRWTGRCAGRAILTAVVEAHVPHLVFSSVASAEHPRASSTTRWAGRKSGCGWIRHAGTHSARSLRSPADIASAVAYLASPDAGFITGISWNVEGGFAA